MTIPKILHFIWFGDAMPQYCVFSIQMFKKMNPDFQINLFRYTLDEIHSLEYSQNVKTQNDKIVHDCIDYILNYRKYNKYIENQKNVFKEKLRFIQLLSDIVRIEVVNKIGGIYLDCDTFPVKRFDDELLSLKRFIVMKHYTNTFISTDNYFLGSCKSDELDEWLFPFSKKTKNACYVLQTTPNWKSNLKFIYNKKLFYDLKLNIGEYSLNKDFYIDHYNAQSWDSLNGNPIKTPICKFDKYSQWKNINI